MTAKCGVLSGRRACQQAFAICSVSYYFVSCMTLQFFPGQLLSNFGYHCIVQKLILILKHLRARVLSLFFFWGDFQMNSIDAAIDRRISESRLAGRMAFQACTKEVTTKFTLIHHFVEPLFRVGLRQQVIGASH